MQGIERQIGRVHNLVVFEAAARHLSFSRAAAELGVTQPAVSQGIRHLEEAVGVRLFQRGHRSLALTDAGERLHEEVSDGFARILAVARQIGRKAHPDHVTLLVSTAFATWWMVPRLAEFRVAHPRIDLRLETVDKDIDLSSEATTLAVRRGTGFWPGYHSALLAPERLFAVASLGFWARHPEVTSVTDLLHLPLVHLEEPHRFRPGWREFFACHGVEFRDTGEGLRLNDYALVVQAAMAGEGVALGWWHICERPIRQGLLAPLAEVQVLTGEGFHLVWSDHVPLSRDAELTRDWMVGRRR
jgi:DNA-binding transcriptional LysR family regulator